ncbi:conserved hypothetical protein [Ricinus communis]|uniref:GH16 domain-containing protein n=1 Tax=Ricinus communis TaxID=3988 RepID=B9TB80_RICCO|nr:conserved hypothetical protein [Ricinus communis]
MAAYPCQPNSLTLLLITSLVMVGSLMVVAGDFYQDVDITWGDGCGKILNNGNVLTLSLDKASGSGFQSKNEYLFGKFDMQLKLVPGNYAGTVTTFYEKEIGSSNSTYGFIQQLTFTPIQSSGIQGILYDWATRGGLVKTDWTQTPFTAAFRNFQANACIWSNGKSSCTNSNGTNNYDKWYSQELDLTNQK